jgi:hypothetical protein
MTNSLTEVTRQLVKAKAAEITYQKLGAELVLSIDWLMKFANGHIKSPNADRVQYIYEKLSGKKLFQQ